VRDLRKMVMMTSRIAEIMFSAVVSTGWNVRLVLVVLDADSSMP